MTLSWYIVQGDKSKPANRCRKWRVVVRKKDGTTRSSTFEGTKTDARKWAPDFAAEVEEEAQYCRDTLGAYMARWADARFAAGEISEGTYKTYRNARLAYSRSCSMPLAEVTPDDIDLDTARIVRSGCTQSTALLYRSKLNTVCRHAVEVGALSRNPVAGSAVPKPQTATRAALSPDALTAVLALPVDDSRAFCASLMARTGIRVGEALGVRWSDWHGNSLHVPRTSTKTAAGERDVPLDAGTVGYIAARRAHLESIHGEVDDSLPLCCRETLEPLTYITFNRWWNRNRDALGCSDAVPHELRHTYLTNLAQAGVHPAVMQRLAGHSTPDVSMRIYTHVQQSDMAEAVDAMAAFRAQNAKNAAKSD